MTVTQEQGITPRRKLGEILISEGLLTDNKLRDILADQQKSKIKLGQFLHRNGILPESRIIDALSRQLKVEKFDAARYPVDPQLALLIPAAMAEKYQVVPVARNGSVLKVGLLDPMDLNALDAVEILTNAEVEPLICSEKDFNSLLGALYGKYSKLGGVMEDYTEMEYDQESSAEKAVTEDVEVGSIYDMAEEAPVIRLVNSILSQAIQEGASDIHFSPEKDHISLRFRVDGRLHTVPAPPKSMFLPIISRFKILSNMDISISRVPQDGRFTIHMGNKEINVRASTIPTVYGENLVLRLLDTSAGIYTMEELGMGEVDIRRLETMINKPYGMILATGPTGSGKSTSLYAILKRINRPDIHIVTLEDPVEYRLDGIRQIQLNRKAGMTFANGLRSVLRQDPDVIMVGEIRDAETANIGVQAALTGHRVLSTVHTNDAAGAITRLLDMGVESFLASSVLLVSIAQRLVRRVCSNCREEYEPPQAALDFFGINRGDGQKFYRGKGCYYCLESGYRGRTGIYEVLIVDDEVEEMILRKASAREITRALSAAGKLTTLKEAAAEKVRLGLTTPEEAASAVMS